MLSNDDILNIITRLSKDAQAGWAMCVALSSALKKRCGYLNFKVEAINTIRDIGYFMSDVVKFEAWTRSDRFLRDGNYDPKNTELSMAVSECSIAYNLIAKDKLTLEESGLTEVEFSMFNDILWSGVFSELELLLEQALSNNTNSELRSESDKINTSGSYDCDICHKKSEGLLCIKPNATLPWFSYKVGDNFDLFKVLDKLVLADVRGRVFDLAQEMCRVPRRVNPNVDEILWVDRYNSMADHMFEYLYQTMSTKIMYKKVTTADDKTYVLLYLASIEEYITRDNLIAIPIGYIAKLASDIKESNDKANISGKAQLMDAIKTAGGSR